MLTTQTLHAYEESTHANSCHVLTDLAACKQAHHLILGSIGVLELIHQDVLVALLHAGTHIRALLEQSNRPTQQVIKVQASAVQPSLQLIVICWSTQQRQHFAWVPVR